MRIPHAPTAEAATIGCAILDPTLAGDLRLGWFHDERHRALVEAIQSLAAAGRPIDEVTVRLRAGTHLAETVEACVSACHSPANFPAWRETLEVKARLRAAWQFHGAARARLETLPEGATPDEEREALAAIEAEFVALGADAGGAEDVSAAEGIDALFDSLESGAEAPVLNTGLPSLDGILRLRPGQMVVIAARPSVGKSALAGRIVEHVALDLRRPVGWFSLEMDRAEVLRRMASALSGVPFEDFERPNEDQQPRIVHALARLKTAPLRICDRGALTFGQMSGLARRWKVRHKVGLLVVDYLGLLRTDGKARSRYEAVTELSQGVKALARDLGVTVLCLAQLNRLAAGNGEEADERPRLHHLRDSGSVEQDADAVVLLHATGFEGGRRTITAAIEKQRNGPLGEAKLALHGPTMRFESVSPIDPADVPRR